MTQTPGRKFLKIAVIPVLFALNGAFLIIYGFMTGADFLVIVFAYLGDSHPISVKDFYVMLGIVRIVIAIIAMKSKNTRAEMIVIGILFAFFSIIGIVSSIAIGGITASNIYGIAIDFIAMLILSLLYLRYVLK